MVTPRTQLRGGGGHAGLQAGGRRARGRGGWGRGAAEPGQRWTGRDVEAPGRAPLTSRGEGTSPELPCLPPGIGPGLTGPQRRPRSSARPPPGPWGQRSWMRGLLPQAALLSSVPAFWPSHSPEVPGEGAPEGTSAWGTRPSLWHQHVPGAPFWASPTHRSHWGQRLPQPSGRLRPMFPPGGRGLRLRSVRPA